MTDLLSSVCTLHFCDSLRLQGGCKSSRFIITCRVRAITAFRRRQIFDNYTICEMLVTLMFQFYVLRCVTILILFPLGNFSVSVSVLFRFFKSDLFSVSVFTSPDLSFS